MALGIRVVRANGTPMTLAAALLREVMLVWELLVGLVELADVRAHLAARHPLAAVGQQEAVRCTTSSSDTRRHADCRSANEQDAITTAATKRASHEPNRNLDLNFPRIPVAMRRLCRERDRRRSCRLGSSRLQPAGLRHATRPRQAERACKNEHDTVDDEDRVRWSGARGGERADRRRWRRRRRSWTRVRATIVGPPAQRRKEYRRTS